MKKFPVVGAIAWWLLIDRLGASPYVFGGYWTLMVIVGISVIYENFKDKNA